LEATLFLSLFLCMYMALMDMVQIVRTQTILQYAVNESAKEISQSTYILTKAGIVRRSAETTDKRKQFEGKTEDMLNSVIELGNAITSGDVVTSVQQAQITVDNVETYFSNSDDLMQGIIAVVKGGTADMAKDFVIEKATEGIVKKQVNYLCDGDADAYLEKLGVKNGLEGLDFSKSEWFSGGTEDIAEIKIVCRYTMHYDLGFFDLGDRTYTVCGRTAVW